MGKKAHAAFLKSKGKGEIWRGSHTWWMPAWLPSGLEWRLTQNGLYKEATVEVLAVLC